MFSRRKTIARRRLRQSKSGVIQCDAAAGIPERKNHFSIEKRPGWIAVQHQNCRSLALVYVVNSDTVFQLQKSTFEWEKFDLLRISAIDLPYFLSPFVCRYWALSIRVTRTSHCQWETIVTALVRGQVRRPSARGQTNTPISHRVRCPPT